MSFPQSSPVTDAELFLLRRLAKVDHEVFQQGAEFVKIFELLREMEQVGWVVLETWPPTMKQQRKARRFTAVAARITEAGQSALKLVGKGKPG